VRISGSNAGYTMFVGSVKDTGYPLYSPVSPSLPLRVPSHFSWNLPILYRRLAVAEGRTGWMRSLNTNVTKFVVS